jgi:hypothetical protein
MPLQPVSLVLLCRGDSEVAEVMSHAHCLLLPSRGKTYDVNRKSRTKPLIMRSLGVPNCPCHRLP